MKGFLKNIFAIITLVVALVSCKETTPPINYKEMEANENALLDKFYDGSHAWDSIYALAIDTIDDRATTGLLYLETLKGSGDSILLGQQVGIRYTYYVILYDLDDNPQVYYFGDNKSDESPLTYTVGSPSAASLYTGVDYGVRKMRNHGKSIMIMPSGISTSSLYYSIVAEVEVDFVEIIEK